MIRYFGEFHVVKNFPPDYAWPKKVLANFMYFIAGFNPRPRANWLERSDLDEVEGLLELGDVLLLGNLRTVLSRFYEGPVTHSGVYSDEGMVINSMADGVGSKDLNQIFREYDTLAVLRLPQDLRDRYQIIRNSLRIAKAQVGAPYDFFFAEQDGAFFCTHFVNSLFQWAGYETGLENVKSQNLKTRPLPPFLYRIKESLQPCEFLKAFDLVYHSSNMIYRNGRLVLLPPGRGEGYRSKQHDCES